jgi:hypothetical protein
MDRIGDVARNRYHTSSGLLDPVRRFLRLAIFAEIGRQYVRPLPRKGDRDGATDTGISAGDQSGPSIELPIAAI